MTADPYMRLSPGRTQEERKHAIPQQVADALPSDPERQLEVAQGIIDAAFRQKAAEMGVELQRLRMAAADKDSHIRSLESRLAECQDNLRDTRSQLQVGLEQNEALQTERASLANALRKLQAFKQNLLHTLQASDMTTDDASARSFSPKDKKDREEGWARRGPTDRHSQPNGHKPLSNSAQAAFSQPESCEQDYLPRSGQADRVNRFPAGSSKAFLNGHNAPHGDHIEPDRHPAGSSQALHLDDIPPHGQLNEAGRSRRLPDDRHGSPVQQSRHTEHSAPQQKYSLDLHSHARARHDGRYQTPDLTRLSFSDAGFGESHESQSRGPGDAQPRSYEPLRESNLDSERRTAKGDYGSPLNILSDMQTSASAEQHERSQSRNAPLQNGQGHFGAHHQAPGDQALSPRNTHDAGYQTVGSYAAASGRPQNTLYSDTLDDIAHPSEADARSAYALPSQQAALPKDRSEGREFFRRARARLSNEAFSTFLQAIKDMNAGMRGRSETLQTAADIFAGPDTDLYHDFKALLDSHLPSK